MVCRGEYNVVCIGSILCSLCLAFCVSGVYMYVLHCLGY